MGEVYVSPEGEERFSAGISRFPYLGAIAHRIRSADLARVYDSGRLDSCVIGTLTQDETIDASIHVPSMLSKHFAIVGTTGVGKSTAVALLLRKALAADPKLRVLILDPHNEFAAAFPTEAVVIDTDTLDLPFWLMRLEEFAEVVFRGRPPVPEELDILRDVIPEAKRAFKGGGDTALMRRPTEKSSITADTPVPYRIADVLALIDERIGRLEGRTEKPSLRSLKVRITAAINDPRYGFMFSSNTITDTILDTIGRIFRVPGDGRPLTTFQLGGIPSEVVNSVASVLCRMAFEIGLWSNGGVHMLVVCEEAHRYVPADPALGFVPTRQAIARIAKEGRKYGVFARHHHPAPGRARSDHPVAMLHRLRHAPVERARPGDHPLGHSQFVDLDDQLHLLDRQRRGDRVRRSGRRADAHAVQAGQGQRTAQGQRLLDEAVRRHAGHRRFADNRRPHALDLRAGDGGLSAAGAGHRPGSRPSAARAGARHRPAAGLGAVAEARGLPP